MRLIKTINTMIVQQQVSYTVETFGNISNKISESELEQWLIEKAMEYGRGDHCVKYKDKFGKMIDGICFTVTANLM